MITENLSTLKIHKLTQAQYNRALAAGNIDENALYLTPDEKQNITITSSNWTNLSQTVSVAGITDSTTVIVAPAPSSHSSYCEAGVYCSAQANGSLTFTCLAVPSDDLTVNVLIL